MREAHKNHDVIFVSHAAGLCGAERSLLDLIFGMKDSNLRPVVISPGYGPFTEVLEKEGVEFHVLRYHAWIGRSGAPLRAMYRILCNIIAAWRFSRVLTGGEVALVYANTTVTPFGALLARFLGVPCLWHVREWLDSFDFGIQRSLGWIGRNASLVVANSKAMQETLAQYIQPAKTKAIYNGPIHWKQPVESDLYKKDAPAKNHVRFCIIGTIYPNKGHEDAIRLLSELKGRGVHAMLEIAGEGDEAHLETLRILASELNVAEQIIWAGFVQMPLDTIRRAHICLICSRKEAFGRVAVEAMSVGTPVICSGVGGLKEIVEPGETGLHYQPGNIEELCDKVMSLINQPDLYHRLRHRAVKYVYRHFTVDIYRQQMFKQMQALMQEEGR